VNIFMLTSVPLVPPWDQGDKNLAYTLTQALAMHRFRVLTMHGGEPPAGDNLDPLPVYRSRHPSMVQKASVFWNFLSFAADNGVAPYPYQQPDLYHLVYRPTSLSSLFSRILPEFKRRPTLHTIPALSAEDPPHPNLFFADRLVVLSKHTQQVLLKLGLRNVTYIPIGIDVANWADLHFKTDLLKSRLGLSEQPVLLYPGHYAPEYGIEILLEALPAIVTELPEVQILCACRLRSPADKKRESSIQHSLNQKGLAKHMRFLNTVTDMRALIGASDLTVLPLMSMRNKIDIPTTLLESLASGVPIVISDLPPMNELLDQSIENDYKAGLVVPSGDADALAQAVVSLIKDRQLRQQFGRNGIAYMQDHFEVRDIARQYEKIYKDMTT